MRTSYLLGVCAIAGLQAMMMAQGLWTQVATTGPSPRFRHAMVCDSQRARIVMFGGTPDGITYLGDTWEWNGTSWSLAATSGPLARIGHGMAYDSQRGRTVLFGGSVSGAYFGDTWEWDGTHWVQPSSVGPGFRGGPRMAFDSMRGRTVMFGGDFSHSDTWEWDGAQWVQVATVGPTALIYHAMAYDRQRGRTVLFGGFGGLGTSTITWEWDGTSWASVASTGPLARVNHVMAYDSQRGKTVMFGGSPGDTWEWDATQWAQVPASGPTGTVAPAMAFDSLRGQTILFGGAAAGIPNSGLAGTWAFQVTLGSAGAFGAGCGGPPLALGPIANARPAINTTAQASLTNIPSSLAFVALGWNNALLGPFALPFHLIGYGMPGCYILQSTEAAAQPVTFTGSGTATYSLSLPNWTGLIGLHLYLQGWAPAPGVNPGNTVVSNGLEWVIGY